MEKKMVDRQIMKETGEIMGRKVVEMSWEGKL